MGKIKSDGSSIFNKFQAVEKYMDASNITSSDLAAINAAGADINKLRPTSKGGRPHRFTQDQEKALVKLVKAGYSIASIAEQFKISKQSVHNITQRNAEDKDNNSNVK